MAGVGNNNNLIPTNKQSKEVARELGRRGGIASGKSKRAKKAFRDALSALLDEKVSKDSNLTRREAIAMNILTSLYKNPNMSDLKKLCEILGEMPGQIISVTTAPKSSVSANDFLNIKLEDKE